MKSTVVCLASFLLILASLCAQSDSPSDRKPKLAADKVMAGLINTTAARVKGAHDAEFVCVDNRAFIVAEANDVQGDTDASRKERIMFGMLE